MKLTVDNNVIITLPAKPTGKKGIHINRHFTKPNKFVYEQVKWVRKDVVMWAGNKITFQRNNVEVPEFWGDKAIQITASKYLYGTTPGEPEYEDSFKQVFDRIANTYTIWGWELGYFDTIDSALAYNQEMKHMLVHQMWAPNSPVWFNLGHWEQHKWGRPNLRKRLSGHGITAYSVLDEDSEKPEVKQYDNPFECPQASACFILGVEDSMDAILKHQYTEGSIFAGGSGIGINISSLRSNGEPITGKGVASGPLSFNAGWDKMAGAIKSGGKTRRAARMVVMYSDHPDVFEFATAKFDQEELAKVIVNEHNVQLGLRKLASEKLKDGNPAEKIAARQLLAMPLVNSNNYTTGMDDLLYGQTLAHQNANHTVSLKAGFWLAYRSGKKYCTRWVKDPKHIVREYDPSELLELMANSIWGSAEPGVHNNDIINFWSTFKDELEIETSNPCSEYLGPTFSSCNLSSVNLVKYHTGELFNIDSFMHAIRIAVIAADMNVSQGGFPTKELAINTVRYRTTGIGFANLGGLLMCLGIPYDSPKGRAVASVIASLMTSTAYKTSAELADALGVYPAYTVTKNSLHKVLNMHMQMSEVLGNIILNKDEPITYTHKLPREESFSAEDAIAAFKKSIGDNAVLSEEWYDVIARATDNWHDIRDCAMRNSFVTCIAPTGTISAPMGIYEEGTTSAEPEYSLVKYKALSGGGSMILVNGMLPKGLKSLGFSQDIIISTVADVSGIAGLEQYLTTQKIEDRLGIKQILKRGGPVAQKIAEEMDKLGTHLDYSAWIANLHMAAAKGQLTPEQAYIYTGQKHLEGLGFTDDVLAVFDCAAKPYGATRSISANGHLQMLGALQPFISGATSKTVNLPADADKEYIYQTLLDAHAYGIKCIAIYRDTSRASEVYTTSENSPKVQNAWSDLVAAAEKTIIEQYSQPKRKRLPFRRSGQTIKFTIGGIDGFLTVGTYEDGTCAEIFGRLGQGGSIAYGMFDAFCKAFSVGLQYDIPFDAYINQFRYMAFDPNGFCKVGDGGEDDPRIHSCKSIIDLLMQILDWLFPEETGRRIRPLPQQEIKYTVDTNRVTDSKSKKAAAQAAALPCPKCGSFDYMFDGHCRTCRSCGYKDGGCGA